MKTFPKLVLNLLSVKFTGCSQAQVQRKKSFVVPALLGVTNLITACRRRKEEAYKHRTFVHYVWSLFDIITKPALGWIFLHNYILYGNCRWVCRYNRNARIYSRKIITPISILQKLGGWIWSYVFMLAYLLRFCMVMLRSSNFVIS